MAESGNNKSQFPTAKTPKKEANRKIGFRGYVMSLNELQAKIN